MRHGKVESLSGQNVRQINRCGGLNPVGGRHGCLKEQGANDIIHRANDAFGFTILRPSVGARHTKMDALGEEKLRALELSNLSHYRTRWP
jgi:hypothetical protein